METIDDLLETIIGFLTAPTLTIVCIIISGQILGITVKTLERGNENLTKDNDHLTINIPGFIKIRTIGQKVIAGLTLFIISFFITSILLSDLAKQLFITNTEFTDKSAMACSLFAGISSVIISLLFSFNYMIVKFIIDYISLREFEIKFSIKKKPKQKLEQETVQKIIDPNQNIYQIQNSEQIQNPE